MMMVTGGSCVMWLDAAPVKVGRHVVHRWTFQKQTLCYFWLYCNDGLFHANKSPKYHKSPSIHSLTRLILHLHFVHHVCFPRLLCNSWPDWSGGKEHWKMVALLLYEKEKHRLLPRGLQVKCALVAEAEKEKEKKEEEKTCKSILKSLTAVSLGGCICGLIFNFSAAWHPELYTVFKRWRNLPVAFKLRIPNPLNFGDFLDQYISYAQECVPDRNLWAFSCMQVMAIREEYAVPT